MDRIRSQTLVPPSSTTLMTMIPGDSSSCAEAFDGSLPKAFEPSLDGECKPSWLYASAGVAQRAVPVSG